MNVRQIRSGAWTAAAMLVAGAMALVAGALLLPYDVGSASLDTAQTTLAPAPSRPQARVTIDDFEPHLANALRLASAVPAEAPDATVETAPPPPPPPVAMPQIQLLATARERESDFAIFKMPDGKIQAKRVGDTIDGAEIIEIRDGIAVMKPLGSDERATATTLRVQLPPS